MSNAKVYTCLNKCGRGFKKRGSVFNALSPAGWHYYIDKNTKKVSWLCDKCLNDWVRS